MLIVRLFFECEFDNACRFSKPEMVRVPEFPEPEPDVVLDDEMGDIEMVFPKSTVAEPVIFVMETEPINVT